MEERRIYQFFVHSFDEVVVQKLIMIDVLQCCMVTDKQMIDMFTEELESREAWVKSAEESQHNTSDGEPHRVFVHCLSDYCNEVNVPEELAVPETDHNAVITRAEGSHDSGYIILEFKTEEG